MMTRPLLQAADIRKRYPGVCALANVSFELAPGEVHALVGENGAGKSTLIRIVTGAERADDGRLVIDGQTIDRALWSPARARACGIASIYQQPALFAHLTVAENIALPLERAGAWTRVDWAERHRVARALLEDTGSTVDPAQPAGSLSLPEQQLVEIARALGAEARILVMDEPTAALSAREVDRLIDVVGRLRGRGVGIIYISHRLDEVFRLADRLTVLRDGATVSTGHASAYSRDMLVQLMAGRAAGSNSAEETRRTPGEIVLEVRRLAHAPSGVHDVSFAARRGEVLGVAGLVGAGRTELAETVMGLRRATSGEVLVGGTKTTISCPRDALRAGLAYVPEDRRKHGVLLAMSVSANASLAVPGQITRFGLLNRRAESQLAARFIGALRIKASSGSVTAGTLSGGNQQKVALARWLATNPEILILDEPTQGVDVGAKAEVHAAIGQLAARGMAVVLISSDLTEIVGLSDRVVVMRQGTIVATLAREEISPARILELALHESRSMVAG
jgi:rhamnose transport system ATP-binding protein